MFQPLDRNLYGAHRLTSPRVRKLYTNYLSDGLFRERKDIVVLTQVLKDPVNSSVSGFAGNAVNKINGVKVTSLAHVHELLNPEKDPEYFVIECDGIPRPIVLPGKLVKEADTRVQRQYGIKSLYNLKSK